MQIVNIDQSLWFKAFPAILANLTLLVYAAIKRPKMRSYLIFFSITTLADICVAAKFIPLPTQNIQVAVEYVFVLIGDLRYILILAFLIYAALPLTDLNAMRLSGAVIRPAFIFTMFPTLLVSALGFAEPDLLNFPRIKFLAYESIFFALTLLWTYVVLPQKNLKATENKFVQRSAYPVFLYYGLWAFSDVLILKGNTMGHVLRIVPNIIYYCGFLWWIALGAEKSTAEVKS